MIKAEGLLLLDFVAAHTKRPVETSGSGAVVKSDYTRIQSRVGQDIHLLPQYSHGPI